MTDLSTLMDDLRRPFAVNSVKYKIQSAWPKDNPRNGLIVPFVDARLISARLNHVAKGEWESRIEPWGSDPSAAVCYLTVCGVTRHGIGKAGGIEKEKAVDSDSLKRAAVRFGISEYLYSLKSIVLKATESGEMQADKPTLRIKSGGKQTVVMTDQADAWLREGYAKWVESDRNSWGPVLDHGDEPDALGDPVEREPIEQEDLELAAQREAVEKYYDAKIASANGKKSKFPKGRFTAQLRAADSLEKLEELRERIKEAAGA